MLFAEVPVLNKPRQMIEEKNTWQTFSPYCWTACEFTVFLLYSKFICLVISEDNISFYALLLRRIRCISGFQPLLGESPIRSLVLFPAPSIPSSTVGLGDERTGRFVPQTIWQCFFCCLLSLPSPLLLPGMEEGVWQPCWDLCISHAQVQSAVGGGSAQAPCFTLPGPSSPPVLQCWEFSVPVYGGTEGTWSIFWFTVIYSGTSPVPQPAAQQGGGMLFLQ